LPRGPARFHLSRPVGHDGRRWVPVRAAPLEGATRNTAYQPLPPLPGGPLRLKLSQILPPAQMAQVARAKKLVFHTVGDVGGIQDPHPQLAVAQALERDLVDAPPEAKPRFLYLLGDIVYFTGAAREYYPQFYLPYMHYPAPIMGIPGNHDGEVEPAGAGAVSLEAYMRNFCAPAPVLTPEAGDTPRKAMVQPYCHFTLDMPYARLCGLYSNVPEGGEVRDAQKAWFTAELKSAPKSKAFIAALHHPLYSLDSFHSGSAAMLALFEDCVARAGRAPDLVLSGHVHNYQRFTRVWRGRQVPCLVVGAGGYHHLHAMARDPAGKKPAPPLAVGQGLSLESFVDRDHGYLKLEISASSVAGSYFSVPSGAADPQSGAILRDKFELKWKSGLVGP
jgi:hypothetical protein